MAKTDTSTTDASTAERTTLVGGVLPAIAGVVGLLGSLHFTIQFSESNFPFGGIIASGVSDVMLLVAFITLALGMRGETGIAGRSIVGRVALILFGSGYLLFSAYTLVPVVAGSEAVIAGGLILDLLVIATGVVAGVAAVQGGQLHGVARWMLLGVGIVNAVLSIPTFIPNADLGLSLAVWRVDILIPLALMALGVTYAVHGRSAAIRHRLHVINENW